MALSEGDAAVGAGIDVKFRCGIKGEQEGCATGDGCTCECVQLGERECLCFVQE